MWACSADEVMFSYPSKLHGCGRKGQDEANMDAFDRSTLPLTSEDGIQCQLQLHFVGRLRESLKSGVTREKMETTGDERGEKRTDEPRCDERT
jgi:hypothetical protein